MTKSNSKADNEKNPQNTEGFFSLETKIFVGWMLTSAGWLITRRNQLSQQQSSNSYEHVDVLSNPELVKPINSIASLLNKPEDLNICDLSKEQKISIRAICAELERLSLNVELGYLSERYVYKTLKTFVQRFFVLSHREINDYRDVANSDTFYKNLEVLTLRQHFYKKPLFQKYVEQILFRPLFDWSGWLIAAHLKTRNTNTWCFLKELIQKKPLPRKIEYFLSMEDFELAKEEYIVRIADVRKYECLIICTFLTVLVLFFIS